MVFLPNFDRVGLAAFWATMRKYNISANLVRTIEQPYDKATREVQINGSMGEWFRTTVVEMQGCLPLPTLFNMFFERIMSNTLLISMLPVILLFVMMCLSFFMFKMCLRL